MAGSIGKARGLCNIFKIIEEPTSTNILAAHNNIISLVDKLPGFFQSMEPWEASNIETRYITRRGFTQRQLLALSHLSEVMSIPIYMREILEDDHIVPKKQLVVIGTASEVMFINYMSRYWYTMVKNVKKTQSKYKPKGVHAREYSAKLEADFLNPFVHHLSQFPIDTVGHETSPITHKIKNEKVLDYLNKNFKFDNQKNKKRIRLFKPKHLL